MGAILAAGAPFEAFFGRYVERPEPTIHSYGLEASYYETAEVDDDALVAIYWSRGSWDPTRFSALLGDIALGRESPWLLLNGDTGDVVAPYDGGVDLFILDEARRSACRSWFERWVSPRTDGL